MPISDVFKPHECWAFDIETLGKLPFNPSKFSKAYKPITNKQPTSIPHITCVCLFNGIKEYALCFYGVSKAIHDTNLTTLLHILDTAQVLVGFNAIKFDLEYIQRFFKLSETQLTAWISKTVDPYAYMKNELGFTCGLSTILAMNQLPSKSASGLQAIVWAKQNRMDLVLEYCMLDTKLTYALCATPQKYFLLNDVWTIQWKYTPHKTKNEQIITWFSERQTLNCFIRLEPSALISTDSLQAQGLVTILPDVCI